LAAARKVFNMFFQSTLPAWSWAVIVSISGSFLNVGGFVMQKQATSSQHDKYWRIGEIICSPKWLLGFIFCVVAPLPGDLLAYHLGPVSLTAPLSGVTVALNLAFAPPILGEKLQPWPDLPATALIMTGGVLTSATGSHSEQHFDKHDMQRLFLQPVFLVAFAILIVLLALCAAYMFYNRAVINQIAEMQPSNPLIFNVMLPAFMAAGCGGLTNVALKAVAELMSSGTWFDIVALSLIGVAPLATAQLQFINMGLRLYLQTIFFPIYIFSLILMNTFYGAIFYQEYVDLMSFYRGSLFSLGVIVITLGISFFTFRKSDSSYAKVDKDANVDKEQAPSMVLGNMQNL